MIADKSQQKMFVGFTLFASLVQADLPFYVLGNRKNKEDGFLVENIQTHKLHLTNCCIFFCSEKVCCVHGEIE